MPTHHNPAAGSIIEGLVTEELLDCQGRVTHRIVLDIDGSVRVTMMPSGQVAVIDPHQGCVVTPGVRLPEHVVHAACAMRIDS